MFDLRAHRKELERAMARSEQSVTDFVDVASEYGQAFDRLLTTVAVLRLQRRLLSVVCLVLLVVVVVLLLTACAGEVAREPDEPGRECVVDFRGAPCSFWCTDCETQPDCENAVGTAVDECLFERSHQ